MKSKEAASCSRGKRKKYLICSLLLMFVDIWKEDRHGRKIGNCLYNSTLNMPPILFIGKARARTDTAI